MYLRLHNLSGRRIRKSIRDFKRMEILRRKCTVHKLKTTCGVSDYSKAMGSSTSGGGSKEKGTEPSISKPKKLVGYVAVAEYQPQAPGEVALTPGLPVQVLEKSDSGWWFVNSEDEQGWAPSTYLEPEGGVQETTVEKAKPGQEETFICIEDFKGAGEDEMNLAKGAVVQVLQKSMDGWWLIRYQGREAYAPGTYLKKASSSHSHALQEKSRLSGVQIISSLQDVSKLLNTKEESQGDSSTSQEKSGSNVLTRRASAIVKQRSLERGGSLIPPPRQNSIKRMNPLISVNKSNVYMTAEAFEDAVGDGVSFDKGMKVYVKEKTSTGWWFVKLGEEEGWVPSSYLEPYTGDTNTNSIYEMACEELEQEDSSDDDDDWYTQPVDSMPDSEPVIVPVQPPQDRGKRPLPVVPPEEGQEKPARDHRWMVSRPLPSPPDDEGEESPQPSGKTVPAVPVLGKAAESQGRMETDLTSALKSRLQSRAQQSTSPVPTRGPSVSQAQTPVLPSTKPSDIKKSQKESMAQPEAQVDSSKPAPFVKLKPVKPTAPGKSDLNQSNEKALHPVALKPTNKFVSGSQTNAQSEAINDTTSSVKTTVKSLTTKPAIATKPKPALKPKPAISAKPSIPSKPSKPSASGQGVASLTNKLNSKLNLGQSPGSTESDRPSDQPVAPMVAAAKPMAAVAKGPQMCVALFSFVAENSSEVSFNEGDELELMEEQEEWSLVRIWDEEGWVPTAYLEKQ